MNKANKIYLERVRKNDWVDRSPESRIEFNPVSLDELVKRMEIVAKVMKTASEVLSKNQPKANFPKGGVEFINPKERHWTENL